MSDSIFEEYAQDNVLASFDLKTIFSKEFKIPKCPLQYFIYSKDVNASSKQQKTELILNNESIINHKRFKIKIDKIEFKDENNHTVYFTEVYTPLKIIGQGSFGVVISVIDSKTNKKLACKIVYKKEGTHSGIYKNEITLLKKLNHPNVIKFESFINTSEYLLIFFELIEGGNLKDFMIERYCSNNGYFLTDFECSLIIKNVLNGLDYLHKNSIIHRDIKPENIMFRDKNDLSSVVICDFGVARETKLNYYSRNQCGTLIYMAPEMILHQSYDYLIDVWAVGIILYILASGGMHPLFRKAVSEKCVYKTFKDKNPWKFPSYFSPLARNMFFKLCKNDPFYRYQTSKALTHPWITRNYRSVIPLNLPELYERKLKIKDFRSMLTCLIFLKIFKDNTQQKNLIKRRITNAQISKAKNICIDFTKYNDASICKNSKNQLKKKTIQILFSPIKKVASYYPNLKMKLKKDNTKISFHDSMNYFNKSYLKNLSNSSMLKMSKTKCSKSLIKFESSKNLKLTRNTTSSTMKSQAKCSSPPMIFSQKTSKKFMESQILRSTTQKILRMKEKEYPLLINSSRKHDLNSTRYQTHRVQFLSTPKKKEMLVNKFSI